MKTSNIALIIGGSSGMGLASAKQMVAQGINTVILGSNTTKLSKAKSELRELANNNVRVETLQADLYKQYDVETIISFIENEKRHVKYLVNAAGYFNPKPY